MYLAIAALLPLVLFKHLAMVMRLLSELDAPSKGH
jgi:hypothetical protein